MTSIRRLIAVISMFTWSLVYHVLASLPSDLTTSWVILFSSSWVLDRCVTPSIVRTEMPA
jgi:hypothetical protein